MRLDVTMDNFEAMQMVDARDDLVEYLLWLQRGRKVAVSLHMSTLNDVVQRSRAQLQCNVQESIALFL